MAAKKGAKNKMQLVALPQTKKINSFRISEWKKGQKNLKNGLQKVVYSQQ
jgi:hypothetical protein